MLKRILVLAILVFFVAGNFSAMAENKGTCADKNALQCTYDWFGNNMQCDKTATTTPAAKNHCLACGKSCCQTCQTDCGKNCCSKCCKK